MINKKTLHFIQLSFAFGIIILFALLHNWGYGGTVETGMMSESMGQMMVSMHASNITLSDLLRQEERTETMTDSHSSHHTGSSETKTVFSITTITIIILLPLIIAGTVFLTIVWIR